jgi:iron transport multicopper oxidase
MVCSYLSRGIFRLSSADSTILTLADWYHASSHNRTQQFPEPNSVLINGLGRTTSTPSSPLTFLNVTGGMRYRIRLINISCHPHFVFSIDSHNLTIIEVDGVNIIPVTVDSITIFASQRYSFVLTANASPDNYWIRANPNKGPSGFDLGINSAVLHYDSAAVAEPAPIPPPATFAPLNETFLHPLVPDEIGSPDVFINLELNFILSDPGVYTVNGATLKPPSLPVLLQILSRSQDPSNLLPSGSVIPLERGKVVELSIPGAFYARCSSNEVFTVVQVASPLVP